MGRIEESEGQHNPPPYPAGAMPGPPPPMPGLPHRPSGYQEASTVVHVQSGGYPGNTVIITTPGRIFSPFPVSLECPTCRNQIVTKTVAESGVLTWLLAGGICLLGGAFGCCLVPFCSQDSE